MTDRNEELRRALVATADAAPYTRPRPKAWMVVTAIAAFAVAGSITGFATATVSQASTGSDPTGATASWVLGFARAHTEFAGPILHVDATGTSDLPLGPKPAEATGLVVVLSCTTVGSFDELLDGEWQAGLNCDDSGSGPGGGSATVFPVTGGGEHTLRIEASTDARYQVWAAWVREPPRPTPSAQQQLELSDGVVTRAEYVAAFNRFIGCLGAAGYDMGGIAQDDSMVIFNYGIPSAAVDDGTDERCYLSEFREVDSTWQISQE